MTGSAATYDKKHAIDHSILYYLVTLLFYTIFFNGLALFFSWFLIGGSLGKTETYSNPNDIPKRSVTVMRYSYDENAVNDFVQETVGADNVSVRDIERNFIDSAKDGEIFEFIGVDDGVKIDGTFYFTEDTIEIAVTDAQEVKEQFSIATN